MFYRVDTLIELEGRISRKEKFTLTLLNFNFQKGIVQQKSFLISLSMGFVTPLPHLCHTFVIHLPHIRHTFITHSSHIHHTFVTHSAHICQLFATNSSKEIAWNWSAIEIDCNEKSLSPFCFERKTVKNIIDRRRTLDTSEEKSPRKIGISKKTVWNLEAFQVLPSD